MKMPPHGWRMQTAPGGRSIEGNIGVGIPDNAKRPSRPGASAQAAWKISQSLCFQLILPCTTTTVGCLKGIRHCLMPSHTPCTHSVLAGRNTMLPSPSTGERFQYCLGKVQHGGKDHAFLVLEVGPSVCNVSERELRVSSSGWKERRVHAPR